MRFNSLNEVDVADGMVQLVDGSRQQGLHLSTESDIVLIPQPSSSDPNDPLRWPRWKKYLAFRNACAFTFLTNSSNSGNARPRIIFPSCACALRPFEAKRD
ncbi:MAG: hypothetical protein Q9214_000309 [Letrouitia sp. 1 TL-2023]